MSEESKKENPDRGADFFGNRGRKKNEAVKRDRKKKKGASVKGCDEGNRNRKRPAGKTGTGNPCYREGKTGGGSQKVDPLENGGDPGPNKTRRREKIKAQKVLGAEGRKRGTKNSV